MMVSYPPPVGQAHTGLNVLCMCTAVYRSANIGLLHDERYLIFGKTRIFLVTHQGKNLGVVEGETGKQCEKFATKYVAVTAKFSSFKEI